MCDCPSSFIDLFYLGRWTPLARLVGLDGALASNQAIQQGYPLQNNLLVDLVFLGELQGPVQIDTILR